MALNYGDAFYSGTALAFGDYLYEASESLAPEFTSVDILSVTQNQTLIHTLTADDSDSPILTFSLVDNTFPWVSIEGSDITLMPKLSITAGTYTVTARVSDGDFNIDQQITVIVNRASAAVLAPFRRVVEWDALQTPDIVLGDSFIHSAILKAGAGTEAFDVSQATSVRAAIVSVDHSKRLTDIVDLDPGSIGADWENGIVSAELSSSVTADMIAGLDKMMLAKIEIEVILVGNSFTWFAPVNLIPGYI